MADNPPPYPCSSPFSFPDGDIILRSADGIDLRVHISLLSLASPFFRDMFSLPQTSNEVQTIEMTEKADVLVAILELIYPFEEPHPYPDKLVLDVYKAADKLQITRVQPISRRRLCPWLEDLPNPLEAWAIAIQLGIPEVIVSAKRRFISANTVACLKTLPDYLKAIPIDDYAALIETKEATIQRGWQCVLETFTCLKVRVPDNLFSVRPSTAVDCTYCITFLHHCRSKIEARQILRPKAMDMKTLRRCHAFAENHECSRGFDERSESDLVRLRFEFRNSISRLLFGIS